MPAQENPIQIARAAALKIVKEMPETFEFGELQQLIYLRQKLEAAEQEWPAHP